MKPAGFARAMRVVFKLIDVLKSDLCTDYAPDLLFKMHSGVFWGSYFFLRQVVEQQVDALQPNKKIYRVSC